MLFLLTAVAAGSLWPSAASLRGSEPGDNPLEEIEDEAPQPSTQKPFTDTARATHVIALSQNAVVAATFVGFGVFARRGLAWVYIFGMVVYALDGLVFAVLALWLEFGFHVFALVMMWGGLSALLELKKLKVATASSGPT